MKSNFVSVIPEVEVDSDSVVSIGLRVFLSFPFAPVSYTLHGSDH